MKNKYLNSVLNDRDIVLTPLRQDILSILAVSNKPMGAYDILDKLKRKRPNAEPPTVYRVLDYLIKNKIIHRIESKNAYVCCSHLSANLALHKSILLLCKVCHTSVEFEDKNLFDAINKFSVKNGLSLDEDLIEMKGICQNCFSP